MQITSIDIFVYIKFFSLDADEKLTLTNKVAIGTTVMQLQRNGRLSITRLRCHNCKTVVQSAAQVA